MYRCQDGMTLQRETVMGTDMTVATTILQQLGGNRFKAMTGAKNLAGGVNYLSFRLPKAKDGINYIKIALDASDTYTLEFGRVHGAAYNVKHTTSGIYNDMLQDCFTQHTGLYTNL